MEAVFVICGFTVSDESTGSTAMGCLSLRRERGRVRVRPRQLGRTDLNPLALVEAERRAEAEIGSPALHTEFSRRVA
jgi:hypothetical protein